MEWANLFALLTMEIRLLRMGCEYQDKITDLANSCLPPKHALTFLNAPDDEFDESNLIHIV
ncbi:hypothetical protein B5V02_30225 [Mesorhizobium kowhaii]|uniref:Uncharacterized protein n=1 Tax=Mesorhizobium kowhaii TaxID=1300272 RepID=A0A2W7DUL9_9HYPH|nr:hypothetical protein B5V02_30225 [Mesorhizobium kowhaii]